MTLALGYQSVAEMLASLDAEEIAEWRAYEAVHGRLDRTWDQEVLAQIHEILQLQLYRDSEKIREVQRPWRAAVTEEEKKQVEQKKKEKEAKEKEATIAALDRALESQGA